MRSAIIRETFMHRFYPSRLALRYFALFLVSLTLLTPFTAAHASSGVVSDCSSYGVPNGLQAALASGNSVTFSCSGTIIVPEIEITGNTSIVVTAQSVT